MMEFGISFLVVIVRSRVERSEMDVFRLSRIERTLSQNCCILVSSSSTENQMQINPMAYMVILSNRASISLSVSEEMVLFLPVGCGFVRPDALVETVVADE
jgi:hypothetical protein